jgi:hypothetical protein
MTQSYDLDVGGYSLKAKDKVRPPPHHHHDTAQLTILLRH